MHVYRITHCSRRLGAAVSAIYFTVVGIRLNNIFSYYCRRSCASGLYVTCSCSILTAERSVIGAVSFGTILRPDCASHAHINVRQSELVTRVQIVERGRRSPPTYQRLDRSIIRHLSCGEPRNEATANPAAANAQSYGDVENVEECDQLFDAWRPGRIRLRVFVNRGPGCTRHTRGTRRGGPVTL